MTTQPEPTQLVLDLEKLKQTFMGDLDIIKQILGAFQVTIKDFEEDFKRLETEGDQEQLSRLVHGLKGSSANIRAESVASQAAALQKKVDQQEDYSDDLNPLLDSIARLDDEISKIQAQ